MYTLFVILIVLASFCMIGIVLIQESKGGGLASAFSELLTQKADFFEEMFNIRPVLRRKKRK